MKLILTAVFAAIAFSSCTTPAVTPAERQLSQEQLPAQWPRCPSLEATWGPAKGPSMQVTGQQAVTYINPATRNCSVSIAYEGATPPREIRTMEGQRASDGKLTIMGQTVDFYGSGNEDPEITTQPVHLTTPGGVTAWYSFSFACKEHLKGKNIPVFTW